MSNTPDDLAALRREIDSIDEQLHDLLMRRGEVVTEIGRRKTAGGQVTFRPGREAQLLRRLLARHRGPLPEGAVVRVWREIIAAAIRLQGQLTVGYCPLEGHGSARRLANGNFGLETPTKRFETASDVVDAVASGAVSVGLVPLPGAGNDQPWWSDMSGAMSVHVVARLPWYEPAETAPGAYVLASGLPEESGDDRSVFALTCPAPVGDAALLAALTDNGLELDPQDVIEDRQASTGCVYIFETGGFVTGDDDRITAAAQALEGAAIRWLGAYARPFVTQQENGAE